MTSLTVVTLLLVLYGMRGRRQYGHALALGGATAAGAAVSVGGIAVPTFYAVAIGATVVVVVDELRRVNFRDGAVPPRVPGLPLLLAFLGWSVVVTLVAPLLFDGQPIVVPTDPNAELQAGQLTSSNIAQIVYLTLAVAVIVFVARSPAIGPEIVGLAVGTTILLSAWRYLHLYYGVPFPERFFDNSPSFAYIATAPDGEMRFRGILSEPAALAGASVITMCYAASRAWQVRGSRRAGLLGLFLTAGFLGLVSTSTTFLVASVVMVLAAVLTFAARFLLRGSAISALTGIATAALVIVALWLVPQVAGFVEAAVEHKVGTSSYDDRSSADTAAYEVFADTLGFGVGLGSNRPSSFLAGLLGSTGLLGTLLFAAVVVGALMRVSAVRQLRPVVWALVATLVLKTISGPDVSDPSGVTWLCLGILAQRGFPTQSNARQDSRAVVEEKR